mmetsp:Transcript_25386/g.51289  ORF Transcript_25386/g.51289 Transcript_25386/m.51289 type:complete len:94 (+) Transcript_25386:53-334(+)
MAEATSSAPAISRTQDGSVASAEMASADDAQLSNMLEEAKDAAPLEEALLLQARQRPVHSGRGQDAENAAEVLCGGLAAGAGERRRSPRGRRR